MAKPAWPAEAVVEAARDGHAPAIAALVSGSHPHVRRFAHALCATPQDAEDAAQEALIILYRKIGMLRATGALASWLFRIVRHECLRLFRSTPFASEPTEAAVAAVPPAEEEVMRRLEVEMVADAIAALPDDQRRVLIMRDVQGHSGGEVARALGISLPAMKSRLHRARNSLHSTLEGHRG